MSSGVSYRPDKLRVFLYQAFALSKLSHDKHTQVGCIIVDKDWRILGAGYNGLPIGISDNDGKRLERPEKYKWMLHSERNALSNCHLRPYGAKAIVTGICCHDCLLSFQQNGISEVWMYDRTFTMLDDEQKRLREEFIAESKMAIYLIGRDESLEKMLSYLEFGVDKMSFAKYNSE
jgi:deoxycytidylate deaminase